jgi:hypothetical protein
MPRLPATLAGRSCRSAISIRRPWKRSHTEPIAHPDGAYNPLIGNPFTFV